MGRNAFENWIRFRRFEIGRFAGNELPRTSGCYEYESFWCSDHEEMLAAVKAGERPRCYYNTREYTIFFTVRESPKPGVLDLCDFESAPAISPDKIFDQLVGIYLELVEQRAFSNIARVTLTGVGASGCARDLYIWQCETDVLDMPGVVRRCWTVDADGLHPDREQSTTNELLCSPRWFCEHPQIKFATDGDHVRFGMSFGPRGYVSRVAPIGPDGKFIPDQLVDANSYFALPEIQRFANARHRTFLKRLGDLVK